MMMYVALLRGAQEMRALQDDVRMRGERESSIPCDDLALALVNVRGVEQIAATPPHQKFRPPRPYRVVTPTTRRGFVRLVFRQLRKREDVAPHPPDGCDLVAVGTHAQRNGQ